MCFQIHTMCIVNINYIFKRLHDTRVFRDTFDSHTCVFSKKHIYLELFTLTIMLNFLYWNKNSIACVTCVLKHHVWHLCMFRHVKFMKTLVEWKHFSPSSSEIFFLFIILQYNSSFQHTIFIIKYMPQCHQTQIFKLKHIYVIPHF